MGRVLLCRKAFEGILRPAYLLHPYSESAAECSFDQKIWWETRHGRACKPLGHKGPGGALVGALDSCIDHTAGFQEAPCLGRAWGGE